MNLLESISSFGMYGLCASLWAGAYLSFKSGANSKALFLGLAAIASTLLIIQTGGKL